MNPIKADIGILVDEKQYKFTGGYWDILELCGFYVRAYKPPWLNEDYDILVVVKHIYEDPESTMLVPMKSTDMESAAFLASELLKTQIDKLYVLYSTGLVSTTCHDEPFIEHIRIAKEAAIERQHFDRAVDLRDQERALRSWTR